MERGASSAQFYYTICCERYNALRDQLLDLLQGGARVEPGRLTARVERTRRPVRSVKALTPVLGEAGVRELQAAVAPTVFRNVIIHPTRRQKR
jgi:hypothetical protein